MIQTSDHSNGGVPRRRRVRASRPARQRGMSSPGDLTGIIDAIRDYAIVLLDAKGRFTTWPAGAQEIFGFTPKEALRRHLRLISTPADRLAKAAEAELRSATAGDSLRGDRWHVRKDGSRFWGSGALGALRDPEGRVTGYFKIVRDNTSRKRDEELLRQAKDEAERANAAKDLFLSNMSHELRTPLSTCLLWAKLLNAPDPPTPEVLKEGLEAIERSAKEQQRMVEDLMDMSRIVNGKLRIQVERLDLASFAKRTVQEFRDGARAKHVKFKTQLGEGDAFVSADPQRLRQIFFNLLGNALKFTPAGGTIMVRVVAHSESMEIQIEDTGEGISAALLPRIFDRFTQAETNVPRTSAGLGLGLAISRQLVELHGGTITAQSPGEGRGSTFTVRLPRSFATVPRAPGESKAPPLPSLRSMHILVVEDTPGTRDAIVTVLRQAGATVTSASSVPQGLKAYQQHRPDLILSDIGLPPDSGHDLLAQIRKWETRHGRPTVPAAALSAYADEKNRRAAADSGFDLFLAKPIEPAPLVTALYALRGS